MKKKEKEKHIQNVNSCGYYRKIVTFFFCIFMFIVHYFYKLKNKKNKYYSILLKNRTCHLL